MSRPTTILVLLQTLLIIVGFFVLGVVLKISGYPHELGVRWNPLAVFLREHGLWLLVTSIVWVFFALAAERLDRGFFSYRLACVIGLCIASLTIVAFLYAAVFPYTRPFYFGR
jgi:hypothetical protein